MKNHCVYIIQQGTNGPFKVGHSSRHPDYGRLESLQTGNPIKLYVRGVYFDDFRCSLDAIRAAASTQYYLVDYHVRGEWFRAEALSKAKKLCQIRGMGFN